MATQEEKPAAQEKKDWAEMSDGEDPEDQKEQEQEVKKEKKKKIPQAKKGFKNDRGDYVVTSIVVPDLRVKNEKELKDESSSDSDTEYDDEDDTKEVK